MSEKKEVIVVKSDIANALTSAAANHVLGVAEDIYDEDLGKYQSEINAEINEIEKKIDGNTYLDKSFEGVNILNGSLQVGTATGKSIPNSFLHIRNVSPNSVTGKNVNGAGFAVNSDGTTSFQHKTYNNDGTGAKNDAVLKFSGKTGLQFAVNTGSGSVPTEDMYKTVAMVEDITPGENVSIEKKNGQVIISATGGGGGGSTEDCWKHEDELKDAYYQKGGDPIDWEAARAINEEVAAAGYGNAIASNIDIFNGEYSNDSIYLYKLDADQEEMFNNVQVFMLVANNMEDQYIYASDDLFIGLSIPGNAWCYLDHKTGEIEIVDPPFDLLNQLMYFYSDDCEAVTRNLIGSSLSTLTIEDKIKSCELPDDFRDVQYCQTTVIRTPNWDIFDSCLEDSTDVIIATGNGLVMSYIVSGEDEDAVRGIFIEYEDSQKTYTLVDKDFSILKANIWYNSDGKPEIPDVNFDDLEIEEMFWPASDEIYNLFDKIVEKYTFEERLEIAGEVHYNDVPETWSLYKHYGLDEIVGSDIWVDLDGIIHYDSRRYGNYILNKETNTWEEYQWNFDDDVDFLENKIGGRDIWIHDGQVYLYYDGNAYLDKETNTWKHKLWYPLKYNQNYLDIRKECLWYDYNNVLHLDDYDKHCVYVKKYKDNNADAWEKIEWDEYNDSILGEYIWKDYNGIIHFNDGMSLYLDKDTNTWKEYYFNNFDPNGIYVWKDSNGVIRYDYERTHYYLSTDNKTWIEVEDDSYPDVTGDCTWVDYEGKSHWDNVSANYIYKNSKGKYLTNHKDSIQEKLLVGNGIEINNNVISATNTQILKDGYGTNIGVDNSINSEIEYIPREWEKITYNIDIDPDKYYYVFHGVDGEGIWKDYNGVIHFSNSHIHLYFNREDNTWHELELGAYDPNEKVSIWTDYNGVFHYDDGSKHSYLDKDDNVWKEYIWESTLPFRYFFGSCIWTDYNGLIHYDSSFDDYHYYLEKETNLWKIYQWDVPSGVNIDGQYTWKDYDGVIHFNYDNSVYLDKDCVTWKEYSFTFSGGEESFVGSDSVWVDYDGIINVITIGPENKYHFYTLCKDNKTFKRTYFKGVNSIATFNIWIDYDGNIIQSFGHNFGSFCLKRSEAKYLSAHGDKIQTELIAGNGVKIDHDLISVDLPSEYKNEIYSAGDGVNWDNVQTDFDMDCVIGSNDDGWELNIRKLNYDEGSKSFWIRKFFEDQYIEYCYCSPGSIDTGLFDYVTEPNKWYKEVENRDGERISVEFEVPSMEFVLINDLYKPSFDEFKNAFGSATKVTIKEQFDTKQDKLIPGYGININGNEISATVTPAYDPDYMVIWFAKTPDGEWTITNTNKSTTWDIQVSRIFLNTKFYLRIEFVGTPFTVPPIITVCNFGFYQGSAPCVSSFNGNIIELSMVNPVDDVWENSNAAQFFLSIRK